MSSRSGETAALAFLGHPLLLLLLLVVVVVATACGVVWCGAREEGRVLAMVGLHIRPEVLPVSGAIQGPGLLCVRLSQLWPLYAGQLAGVVHVLTVTPAAAAAAPVAVAEAACCWVTDPTCDTRASPCMAFV